MFPNNFEKRKIAVSTFPYPVAYICVELCEVEVDVKTLSELLGRSSVEITLNRHVHSSFEQKREKSQEF